KVFIVSGAAASDITGPKCNANTIHWTYDTWMLANGTGKALVKAGGDSWFFLTADYAFGHALERDTGAAVTAARRKVAGPSSPSAKYVGLLLVPSSGAEFKSQDRWSGQRRRRHHQLDQARCRVRDCQRRAEIRGPPRIRKRCERAGFAHCPGSHLDGDLVLG